MCSPFRSDGSRRNGPPADVRCAVMIRLPISPGPRPPRRPRGLAATPRFWIRVPGRSSACPTYGRTGSERIPIEGIVIDIFAKGRRLTVRAASAGRGAAAGEARPADNTAVSAPDGVTCSGLEHPIRATMSKAETPAAPGLVAVSRDPIIRSGSCPRPAETKATPRKASRDPLEPLGGGERNGMRTPASQVRPSGWGRWSGVSFADEFLAKSALSDAPSGCDRVPGMPSRRWGHLRTSSTSSMPFRRSGR
jgi:hypothetical protein